MTSSERKAVSAGADDWLRRLCEWVAIPSVSADPRRHAEVAASATYLADWLRDVGFPAVEVLGAGPYLPAVLAHWSSGREGALRVLVYGHHDVQPADIDDGWSYPPFEPHVVDGLVHGRGASDDKGNVAAHLLGLAAHLAATGRSAPAVDLTLLVEGEEESGSPHFSALLADVVDAAGDCRPDVVVVSDTGIFDAATPSVVTGMRGMVEGELTVRGPEIDLHSGSFGGAVANPITELVRILAAMHDTGGHITIPGFYDRVPEPTEAEHALLAALPFDERSWVTGPARSTAAVGEVGYTTLERLGMRPTAEINGINGGYTGPGGKTIVPADATAKLSFRLVGRQDPTEIARLVDAFVADQAGPGVTAQMRWTPGGVRPIVVPADHPATLAARRSLAVAFDAETVLVTREGGSGPEAELASTTGAPMIFLGVMTDDDQIHAPDERARLDLLRRGAEAAAHLWRELGGLDRTALS